MKNIKSVIFAIVGSVILFASCQKNKPDVIYTSVPVIKAAQGISDSVPLCGNYKGHMLSGKTYTVGAGCNITVNAGDTLFMDADVKLYMSPASSIVVKGIFISLGTADHPNWITVNGLTRTDDPSVAAGSDSAYTSKRLWCGINCDTSCALLVLKWTHVDYTSANFVGTGPIGLAGTSHAILFQNPNGSFIMEDSWMYGSVDEVRITSGKFAILRNTIEKFGLTGGDGFNAKHGSVGDMAYNLFIGIATNGTKGSDKGTNVADQTEINMYNNTYVNCGYRRNSAGRGGCINYEEGAKGKAYNNIMVNCKYGLRIVNNPPADTSHLRYGNSLNYGDSAVITDQFYPQGYITIPQPTDIPAPSSFLPTSYTLGQVYSGASVVGANNPKFVSFPLPATQGIVNIAYTTGFDFHLQSSSLGINKGFTGFTPLMKVPIDPVYGATEITGPGKDLGCYQADGTGNKH